MLQSEADVNTWKADYLAWVAALRLRFNTYADPACHDWQRLYRVPHAVPHATRTAGGRTEARETLGNPYRIGIWSCEPTSEERELAKTLAKRPTSGRRRQAPPRSLVNVGDGVLFQAFQSRGWIGHVLEAGKWSARCPWEDQHTKGETFDTSTVLFAPSAGDTLGWLHLNSTTPQPMPPTNGAVVQAYGYGVSRARSAVPMLGSTHGNGLCGPCAHPPWARMRGATAQIG
jgi:hypothetical protein